MPVVTLFLLCFVSEDLALFSGIAMVRGSVVNIPQFCLAYLAGILVGDLGCYFLGFLLSHFKPKLGGRFSKLRLQRKFGLRPLASMLLIARFTPAIKLPVFVYSGWVRYPLYRYLFWLFSLTLIQVSIVTGFLYLNPNAPLTWLQILWNTVIIYIAIYLLFRTITFCIIHRQQLKLHLQAKVYWWLRYHNRQYWPLWFLYIPLYFYLPWLGLKYRSVWAWFYVNPGLPNGGWWSEKKSAMDAILRKHMLDSYLPGLSLDPIEFLSQSFTDQQRQLAERTYPLVAKPDQGKQGKGVDIAHNSEELLEIIKSSEEPLFLQDFDSSAGEAGILFFRNLQTRRIELFSITDKKFPTVTADGKSNIFELILKDKQARFIAPIYLAQCRLQLTQILPKGQILTLTHLGNHSKGALFYSAESFMTARLEERLNALLADANGIDFGRFDVKYISPQRLMEGEFKIIELNGAGAESTNIHDPKFSLREVYQILFRQWEILFILGSPHEKSFAHSLKKLSDSIFRSQAID